ncbi:MAG: translation elongation factor 4 [Spirochaetes bacterium]|nr:translation elongation factor 4 [Spirochaetota bacterium]
MKNIRNFCIIAHIDHGKTTLADRLIEWTGLLPKEEKEKHKQILDTMEIEKERGITIKSQTVRLTHNFDGKDYILNLIDTPGHVDFTYEVSRALKACEGAILVVDASQGIEAQTLSNFYLAFNENLEIIPVINKIDLPNADINMCLEELNNEFGYKKEEVLLISAKNGTNIDILLDEIVKRIPPPRGDEKNPLKALVFDAIYDNYKGVIVYVRLFDGELKVGDEIIFMSKEEKIFKVEEVGYIQLKFKPCEKLQTGEVGYFTASIKNISDARIGDTVTTFYNKALEPLEGYKEVKPYVFSSVFPVDPDEFEALSFAMEKLKLNDPALIYEKDNSLALGFGFRCGFLGMLHLEVFTERLSREHNIDVILTAPSVTYKVKLKNSEEVIFIDNPIKFPDPVEIEETYEPYVKAEIVVTSEYIGNCISLAESARGVQIGITYIDSKRVLLEYEIPLAEIIYNFYDRLKSISKGYASLDYHIIGYKESKLVKLDILVAHEKIDAFSQIVYEGSAVYKGRQIVERLKDIIPRQQFPVALQAAIGNKIIARETISAFRKDVLAKCYGGDITRKRKLLEKQKEGKKKLKRFGKVDIPQDAFVKILKTSEDENK